MTPTSETASVQARRISKDGLLLPARTRTVPVAEGDVGGVPGAVVAAAGGQGAVAPPDLGLHPDAAAGRGAGGYLAPAARHLAAAAEPERRLPRAPSAVDRRSFVVLNTLDKLFTLFFLGLIIDFDDAADELVDLGILEIHERVRVVRASAGADPSLEWSKNGQDQ